MRIRYQFDWVVVVTGTELKERNKQMDYYDKEKERIFKLRAEAFRELMKWEKKKLVQSIIDRSDEDTLEEWAMGHSGGESP